MGDKQEPVILNPLQFVWFECQDVRDAVVFCHTMTDRLGAKNLLGHLPVDPTDAKRRLPKNKPAVAIDVVLRNHTSASKIKYQAVIGFPKGSAGDFLGEWFWNPGVEKGEFTTKTVPEQADLVVVSGHGSAGMVWGDGFASGTIQTIEVARKMAEKRSSIRSGRMKLLMLPSCYNALFDTFEIWEPLFRRNLPLYWLFGYEKPYAGDEIGANVMNAFSKLLRDDPKKPLIEVWRLANKSQSQPWAAFVLKGAEAASYEDWASGKLPVLDGKGDILHFAEKHTGGVKAVANADPYRLRYVHSSGTVVNSGNRYMLHLVSGEAGKIRIECEPGTPDLKAGDTIHLYAFLYRPDHAGPKLDKVFLFDPSVTGVDPGLKKPIVEFLVNDNPWLKAKTPNPDNSSKTGLLVRIPKDGRSLELPYTVKSDLSKTFTQDGPVDSNGNTSYGNWILGMFPPNTPPAATPAGADIRTPVYAYSQGMLLCDP